MQWLCFKKTIFPLEKKRGKQVKENFQVVNFVILLKVNGSFFRSYNASNLMEDLKYLYKVAGREGQGIAFIFTDQEIKEEGFLEYLNNLLSSGEISNLFARDEIDEICGELIPVMKKEFPRRPPTGENLYNYFLTRAKHNLHVVLCFSPVCQCSLYFMMNFAFEVKMYF